MVIAIFVNRAYHQYAQGYNFPNRTTPKKFPFPSYRSFFGAHPCFWPFWAIPQSLLDYFQQPVCSPRRYCSFPTLGAIFRLFIPELWPFLQKKLGRRVKKSSPSPLWGLSLPVTALALSTQALRFVRGLVKAQSVFFFKKSLWLSRPPALNGKCHIFPFFEPPLSDCWRSTPCRQHMAISDTVMRQVKRLILRQGLTDL